MVNLYIRLFWKRNWKKYIPVVILILIQCQTFRNILQGYESYFGIRFEVSAGDYIADFCKGTIPYTMGGSQEPFNIPAIWSLYYIYFFAVIGHSVSQTARNYEMQITLRCVSRARWWRYQNLMLWMETAGYLLVTGLAFLLYGGCTGALPGIFHQDVQLGCAGMDLAGYQTGDFLLFVFLMPLLVMTAVAYIQYTASIKGNALVGILISVVLLVSSVFHKNPLLIFNALMLMRQSGVMEQGINPIAEIGICAAIIVIMSLLMRKMIEKKDLM